VRPRRAAAVLLAATALAGGATTTAVAGSPGTRVRELRFVDDSRRAEFRDGSSGPRVLATEVRYPAHGRGPFPLVVFAHGFAETPDAYAGLLDSWARAGYAVAAPRFPVERPNAPGGPSQSDLVNEPGDLHFVISRVTSGRGPLRGLIDATRIAVAGQSDGAVAALSVAYDRRFRDPRIDAALVMSGAALPGFARPPSRAAPLLAIQGTRDPLNAPGTTLGYFRRMRRPKFLLWLIGAPHLEPYTTDDRWAGVVRRTTVAFLGRYLRGAPLRRIVEAGSVAGVGRVTSAP
jgi:fermentation-respiration switch protein FrsA (DUF1100 family)